MHAPLCRNIQAVVLYAGDEVVAGSAELEEVVSYAGMDTCSQPRQFSTGISKKKDDGELEELIKARTTWI